ncbi:MAG: ParB/RepB/Spo0J family partition protein [Phormidesmis sp.]
MNKFKDLFEATQSTVDTTPKQSADLSATKSQEQSTPTLPVSQIILPASQPRRYFDSERMLQLEKSIKEHGVLEPVLVRPLPGTNTKYELVAGERRYRAAKKAGLRDLPVVIKKMDDQEAGQIALIENLQREDLNPIEETEGILNLLELELKRSRTDVLNLLYRMRNESNGKSSQNVLTSDEAKDVEALFGYLGRLSWESFITTRLPLLKLPEDVLEALREGSLAYTKAQTIARIKDPMQRSKVLMEAVSKDLSLNHIKKRIAELKGDDNKSDDHGLPSLKTRAENALKQIKRTKIWDDPAKKKKLERLVSQLETLVEES